MKSDEIRLLGEVFAIHESYLQSKLRFYLFNRRYGASYYLQMYFMNSIISFSFNIYRVVTESSFGI